MSKNIIQKMGGGVRHLHTVGTTALWVGLTFGAANAMAALPTVAAPTNAASEGNYIELLKGYAFDISILLGLVLGVVAFLVVVNNMIGVYKEIGAGKKQWGDMGMHGGMGVMLLVFVIYLLTEASKVIFV